MTAGGSSGDEAVTIAFLHTPGGTGGIAVIGLAGPRVQSILTEVFRCRCGDSAATQAAAPMGEVIRLGDLYDGTERLDEAIVAATGSAAEINIHGGPRVAQRTLQVLARAGAKIVADDPAAWEALNLWPLAAEGLANPAIGRELLQCLPRAHTEMALAALSNQWRGGLSELARRVPSGSSGSNRDLADELLAAASRLAAMQRLLSPPEIALAGPPNAGKSTLTNALAGREVCIVTDTPGTTRDWVRELADIQGLAVWLTDTAGLWAPDDALGAEAVRRSWRRIDEADLVLAILDAADPPTADDGHWMRLLAEPNVLRVANKCDLAATPTGWVAVAAESGIGLEPLGQAIRARLGLEDFDPAAPAAFTPRQARCLRRAAESIRADDSVGAKNALDELLGC